MLREYNTFKLDHKAKEVLVVTTLEELKGALWKYPDALILGGGSNVLFVQDIDRAVIVMDIKGIELRNESVETVEVKVAAGEEWHPFVLYAIDKDWGGIENLSLIPGKCGAAPMQNIGAYGVEVSDVLHSVECLRRSDQTIVHFSKEECALGYRSSNFKGIWKDHYVILSITIRLTKAHYHSINTAYGAIQDRLSQRGIKHPSIQDVSEAVISIRRSKLPDPIHLPNAGSFFKNPIISRSSYDTLLLACPDMPSYTVDNERVKIPAGWLIDRCGWKGVRIGEVGVHKDQALVIVNHGATEGKHIKTLSEQITDSVYKRFGVKLVPEVNMV